MPRHFWAWPSLFFFRQKMKLMRNEKGLRYDVVLCLHCSSLKIFQGVQKIKGYAGVVAGSNVKPGSENRDARRQDRNRYLCFSHRNQSQEALFLLPGTLLIHMFFFSPHPNNSFPTEFPNTK